MLSYLSQLSIRILPFIIVGGVLIAPTPTLASIPADYGYVTIQRTAEDTGNVMDWCQGSTASTYFASSTPDANSYYYYVADHYTGSLYGFQTQHNENCDEADPAYYRTPAPLGDTSQGYEVYMITGGTVGATVSGQKVIFVDKDGLNEEHVITPTYESYAFGGENYVLWKFDTGLDSDNSNLGLLSEIKYNGDSNRNKVYAVIYSQEDLLATMNSAVDLQNYITNLQYNIANGITSSSTDENPGCPTCTRVVLTDPANGEFVATSTPFDYYTEIYVNEDEFGTPFTTMHALIKVINPEAVVNQSDVVIEEAGYNNLHTYLENVTASGPYAVTIEIYKDYPIFNVTKLLEFRKFYVSTTTLTEAQQAKHSTFMSSNGYGSSIAFSSINCEVMSWNVGIDMECVFKYIKAFFIPDSVPAIAKMKASVSTLLSIAPWGYVTRFYDILYNPATSTIPYVTMSFPADSPASGKILALNLDAPIQQAYAQLDEIRVDTIDGSPVDKFFFYWNTLWYILFGFWLVSQVLNFMGIEGISIGTETVNEKPKNYQKTGGVRGVSRARERGSNNVPMSRSQFSHGGKAPQGYYD